MEFDRPYYHNGKPETWWKTPGRKIFSLFSLLICVLLRILSFECCSSLISKSPE